MAATRLTPQSADTCPLRDPEIGIISETEHRAGLCLCQFCTCSTHKCPSQYTRPGLPLKTEYALNFKAKLLESPLKLPPSPMVRNSQPMELVTTHNADYVAHPVMPRSHSPTIRPLSRLSLLGTSSYRNEYPNWGKRPVYHHKEWFPPVRSTELQFQASTVYRQDFRDVQTPQKLRLAQPRGSFSLVPSEAIDCKSTYSVTMRRPQATAQRKKRPAEVYRQTAASPTHFSSTTNQDYRFPVPNSPKDPRILRKFLMSRG